MRNHRWTPDQLADLRVYVAQGMPNRRIAVLVDHSYRSVTAVVSQLGLHRGLAYCAVCHTEIVQPKTGRKRQYCRRECGVALRQAVASNACIDARANRVCIHCGDPLPATSIALKTTCSRACSNRAWHERTKNDPGRRAAQKAAQRKSRQKKRASA